MIKLSRENQTSLKLPAGLKFRHWLEATLKILGETGREGMIELSFVLPDRIKSLNKAYRQTDKTTDVLSFSFINESAFPTDNLIGQIFIEPVTAKKQAAEKGVLWKDELEFLFVHALLHVFGYDHETEEDFNDMFGLQARIMPGQKWGSFVEQIRRENFGRGV
jgi:probable rRNA maturation factor